MPDCVCIHQISACFADLINVFESFLPQLLLYPNPSDPFNGEAASLLMRDRAAYELKVKGKVTLFFPFFASLFNLSLTLQFFTFEEYCEKYAKPEKENLSDDDEDDDDDSMSEDGSDSDDDDDEIVGKADP